MQYVDLSHEIYEGMPIYPNKEGIKIDSQESFSEDDDGIVRGGRWKELEMKNHHGTHIDAPSHMRKDGAFLDDYSIDAYVFSARKVDCRDKPSGEEIKADDCPEPTDHEMLVFETGWSQYWGSDQYYRHPVLSTEAAEYCVENGYHVALESFSPDPIPAVDLTGGMVEEPKRFPAHDILFEGNRFIVENITNLESVPNEFELLAFPVPIRESDGSPIRAVGHF